MESTIARVSLCLMQLASQHAFIKKEKTQLRWRVTSVLVGKSFTCFSPSSIINWNIREKKKAKKAIPIKVKKKDQEPHQKSRKWPSLFIKTVILVSFYKLSQPFEHITFIVSKFEKISSSENFCLLYCIFLERSFSLMDVSMKKRTLLKVIVLGDSGYVSKFFFFIIFLTFYLDGFETLSTVLHYILDNIFYFSCSFSQKLWISLLVMFRVGKTSLMNQYPLHNHKCFE